MTLNEKKRDRLLYLLKGIFTEKFRCSSIAMLSRLFYLQRFQNTFARSSLLEDRITLHFFSASVMLLQTRPWYIKRHYELPKKVMSIQVLAIHLKGRTTDVQRGPQQNPMSGGCFIWAYTSLGKVLFFAFPWRGLGAGNFVA